MQTVNVVPSDPPSTWGFAMVKFGTESRGGYVKLQSNNPREVPDINFRFFEDGSAGDADLNALAEAVDYGRKIFDAIPAPLGPFKENWPCEDGTRSCNVKQIIKEQTWSHHATSTCSIGPDSDPLAVLDSRFRVRGIKNLRVVDGSAFPRVPGAFPVVSNLFSNKFSFLRGARVCITCCEEFAQRILLRGVKYLFYSKNKCQLTITTGCYIYA